MCTVVGHIILSAQRRGSPRSFGCVPGFLYSWAGGWGCATLTLKWPPYIYITLMQEIVLFAVIYMYLLLVHVIRYLCRPDLVECTCVRLSIATADAAPPTLLLYMIVLGWTESMRARTVATCAAAVCDWKFMLFLIDPQPPCHGTSFGHFYSSTYITEPRNIPISYVAHFVEIWRVQRVVNIAEPQRHFCKRNWANRGLTNNKTVGAQRLVTVLWQNNTENSPWLGCYYIPHRPHTSASSTAILRFVWELRFAILEERT